MEFEIVDNWTLVDAGSLSSMFVVSRTLALSTMEYKVSNRMFNTRGRREHSTIQD